MAEGVTLPRQLVFKFLVQALVVLAQKFLLRLNRLLSAYQVQGLGLGIQRLELSVREIHERLALRFFSPHGRGNLPECIPVVYRSEHYKTCA